MTTNALDQKVKRLQLRTRYPVEHLLAGEYRSVFKGRGMDFDELREYAPGDDVRTIDWNVTARTGKPYIRRYIEERELAVWFLVDASASCRSAAGASSKWETVHEIVALLSLSAAHNHDRAGLIMFSDQVEHVLPALNGEDGEWMSYQGQEVISRLDEKTLNQLAAVSPAVIYFPARTKPFDLLTLYRRVLAETDELVIGDESQVVFTEGYRYFVALALMFF